MKIKKIKTIKKFGIFNNFQWQGNCQEFAQYNFFYGWNYSGKTTLSRVLRSLEIKERHKDFPDMEFSIETDNGIIIHRDISNDYPIRVFNEDFVEENFQWNNEDAKIEPVLILGKEAKELEQKLKELEEQKREKANRSNAHSQEIEKIKGDLESSLTNKASEIRNILAITNPREFDRNKLEENIKNIKDYWKNRILSTDKKERALNTYRSKKLEKIPFTTIQLKLSTFIEEVKNVLNRKVSAQEVIEKLKANPELSDWVKKGIDLHKNERVCQFCGNPLPSDLFERLNKHFSQEFDNLMVEIDKEEKKISEHIDELYGLTLPDKARLFEDLQTKFEDALKSLNNIKYGYIKNLELLKNELKRKKEKPFDSLELQSLSYNIGEVTNALEKIETIINQHNSKVDSFENEKQQAKEKLINHFTAEFIEEKNYFKAQEKIETLSNYTKTLESEINGLDNQIRDINKQIKAEAVGAERMNEYLRCFFNGDKLRIELTDDGKYYKLYRNDEIAKNLSTGEKNIISLIYFFTKLEETRFDFTNAVIFIDDPVSSLDSNHTFKVYGFISEKLRNCGQLFITTHNFDFFNLLKDLNKFDLNNQGKFYLVKKVKTQPEEFSSFGNLPETLLKHKSEYNYLFSILKEFNDLNDKSNFELLYILPNILRRFFEAYLFMKYPDGKRFKEKTKKFLEEKKSSDKDMALKLMDEYSHEENPSHIQKFPDIQEVENAIRFILETIKEKDKEHYDALENSLTN